MFDSFHHSIPLVSPSNGHFTEFTFIFYITRARWTLIGFSTVPIICDLLVHCPETHAQDLALAWRKRRESFLDVHSVRRAFAAAAILLDGSVNGADQVVVIYWLGEKI